MADNNSNQQKTGLSWSQPNQQNQNKPVTPVPPPPPKNTPVPPKNGNTGESKGKWLWWTAGAIIVLALIAWMVTASRSDTDNRGGNNNGTATTTNNGGSNSGSTTNNNTGSTGGTTGSNTTTGGTTSNSSLVVPTQDAGLQVAINKVVVTEPTWVVVYESRNGQPGNALGAGLFIKGQESGVVSLLRGTLPGQTYFVGQSRDDGDRIFGLRNDPAIRDANGNPVWIQFTTR